jgi:hypothetical protein
MKAKPLIETNPYLKDAKTREMLIARSVRTSCGVEGIKAPSKDAVPFEIKHRKDKKIYRLIK